MIAQGVSSIEGLSEAFLSVLAEGFFAPGLPSRSAIWFCIGRQINVDFLSTQHLHPSPGTSLNDAAESPRDLLFLPVSAAVVDHQYDLQLRDSASTEARHCPLPNHC